MDREDHLPDPWNPRQSHITTTHVISSEFFTIKMCGNWKSNTRVVSLSQEFCSLKASIIASEVLIMTYALKDQSTP